MKTFIFKLAVIGIIILSLSLANAQNGDLAMVSNVNLITSGNSIAKDFFVRAYFRYLKRHIPIDHLMTSDNKRFIRVSNLNDEIYDISLSSNLFQEAFAAFEVWDFKQSKQLFQQYLEIFPDDNYAKFYLALSELCIGNYGCAATNLSILNKMISLKNNPSDREFLDDIKFYFALSFLKISKERRIPKFLFNQLDYTGGKYAEIAKEMIDLL